MTRLWTLETVRPSFGGERGWIDHAQADVVSGQRTTERRSHWVLPVGQRKPPQARRTSRRIRVVGVREHNLNDVSLSIPKNRITAFLGTSGSGKSAIVFGSPKFAVECLSAVLDVCHQGDGYV